MIDTLHEFQGRIDQLLAFLDDAETLNALAAMYVSGDDTHHEAGGIGAHLARLRSSKIDRKVQTYVTAVILLYGLFEQYVEEVLIGYLDQIDSIIASYDDLPEKVRQSHTGLSAQLLLNRELDKYRDRCSEAEIIQRLHSCAVGGPFRLNTLAFVDHKSNFRIETLNQFFDVAGISRMSALVRHEDAFEEYKARKFPNQEIDRLPDKVVFEDLDDLAWRRNVVAHRWPDSTLSINLMKERAGFIRVLGECIYAALQQSALSYTVKHKGHALASPLAVYDHSIVCFHLDAGAISTGSRMVARGSTGRYAEGKVVSMEVNHVPQETVAAPPPVDVGCRVSFKAKLNQEYFLVDEP